MNYESVLVIQPALGKATQKAFFQTLKETIKQFKGNIYHIDTWGARKLANKNKKRWSQGLYFHFSFKGEKGVVEELVRKIKMEEKVLYYHFEKLSSKKSLEEHLTDFRTLLEETSRREKERLSKIQKRKTFFSSKKGSL